MPAVFILDNDLYVADGYQQPSASPSATGEPAAYAIPQESSYLEQDTSTNNHSRDQHGRQTTRTLRGSSRVELESRFAQMYEGKKEKALKVLTKVVFIVLLLIIIILAATGSWSTSKSNHNSLFNVTNDDVVDLPETSPAGAIHVVEMTTIATPKASTSSSSKPNLLARTTPTLATSEFAVYAIGGQDRSGNSLATIEQYDLDHCTWRAATAMPTARHYLAATVFHGNIYAIGGKSNSAALAVVERFDGVSWHAEHPLPHPRYALAAVVFDDHLVVLGGDDGGDNRLATVVQYTEGQWTKLPSMTVGRYGCGVASLNGILYVVGGLSNTAHHASVERFDGTLWKVVAFMPTTSYGITAGVYNGNLFAFGGVDSGTYQTVKYLDAAFKLTQDETRMTSAPSMKTPRFSPSVVLVSSKLCVLGGGYKQGVPEEGANTALSSVECFNGSGWMEIAQMVTPRFALASTFFPLTATTTSTTSATATTTTTTTNTPGCWDRGQDYRNNRFCHDHGKRACYASMDACLGESLHLRQQQVLPPLLLPVPHSNL